MKIRYFKLVFALGAVMTFTSCQKFFDINKDPDRLPSDAKIYNYLLANPQVAIGFEGGSDLFRYTTLIMQQMSGNASQPNQTYDYYRYNITGTDQNNVWGLMNATTLSDLELVIRQATADGSPYYVGIAKILKAYEYSKMVDTWGDIPFTEGLQYDLNTQPKYDDDETIYPKLIAMLAGAITDLNAATSTQTPGTNSVIYSSATWATARAQWIKLANTLRLRLLLHYSKKNPSFAVTEMTNLINSAGAANFMASNADNFQVNFFNVQNQRNPISAFEVSRPNYLFADAFMVGMMNAKNDPRRPFYFTDFPLGSGNYVGVSATSPPTAPNNNYSRIHTFLRGAVTTPPVGTNSGVYSGAAPQRLLPYTEYCFIRAEAALMGVGTAADAQTWFTAGITASMQEVGVSAANITTYLAANGTLTGTNAQKLQQIIEEKYIALFGVPVEPWTDWRRTGYPAITPPTNRLASVPNVPRSLFYPQSEIDFNPNCPGQKPADLQSKVFWDN